MLCAKWSGRDRVVRFDCLHEATDLFAENGPPDDFFQGMEARHVMTSFVINLRESETVGQAAEFFLRSRISSAPVVDASGLLVWHLVGEGRDGRDDVAELLVVARSAN